MTLYCVCMALISIAITIPAYLEPKKNIYETNCVERFGYKCAKALTNSYKRVVLVLVVAADKCSLHFTVVWVAICLFCRLLFGRPGSVSGRLNTVISNFSESANSFSPTPGRLASPRPCGRAHCPPKKETSDSHQLESAYTF